MKKIQKCSSKVIIIADDLMITRQIYKKSLIQKDLSTNNKCHVRCSSISCFVFLP